MRRFLYTLLYILSLLLSFFGGYGYKSFTHKCQLPNEVVKIDTLYINDTIIQPVPQIKRIIRTDTIFTSGDTVYLPIQQSEVIQDIDNDTVKGQIKVVYSGYNSVIDTLQYNLSTVTKTVYKRKKWGFTVGISSGAAYDFENKFTPYIGIGVVYGIHF